MWPRRLRAVAATAAALIASQALAFRSGPPPAENGSPASSGNTCRICHGNNPGTGSVQILNAPTKYLPNRIYDITVRISDPVQLGAGFELSAEANSGGHTGTLIRSDTTNTRFAATFPQVNVWIEHTSTGVNNAVANWSANGNSAEYHVQWQAPASSVGGVTFWAAGNAINNNLANTGDIIYLTNVSATFNSCPADLDGDGMVGAADLAQLLGSWGPSTPNAPADLDNSGSVTASDLALLLGSWGPCP